MPSVASGMPPRQEKGLKMLLPKTPNVLTKLKETNMIVTDSVLKTLNEEAATFNTEVVEGTKVIVRRE